MKNRVKKLIGYGLSVALIGGVTIISIPFMISIGGIAQWTAFAYGQSFGLLGSVFVGYGWALSGPATIARASPVNYRRLYVDSLRARLCLFFPILIITSLIIVLAPSGNPLYAMLGSCAGVLMGVRANWFFVGISSPYLLLLLETIPRLLLSLLGLAAMLLCGDISFAIWGQIMGGILAVSVSSIWIMRTKTFPRNKNHEDIDENLSVLQLLRTNRHGMSASVISSIYANFPLIIMGYVSPISVQSYAVIDRVYKQLNTAFSPIFDVLRGWVPTRDMTASRKRAKQTLIGTAVASGVFFGFMVFIAPWIVSFLSTGTVILNWLTSIAFSLMFSLSLYSMVQGQVVLASLNLMSSLAKNIRISSLVSLPVIAAVGFSWGVEGVLFGIAAGRILLIILNYLALRTDRLHSVVSGAYSTASG